VCTAGTAARRAPAIGRPVRASTTHTTTRPSARSSCGTGASIGPAPPFVTPLVLHAHSASSAATGTRLDGSLIVGV
jgi:hypothetical protein